MIIPTAAQSVHVLADFQARISAGPHTREPDPSLGGGESTMVVAVDPGPIPGVVMLRQGRTAVFQCDPDSVIWLVRELVTGGQVVARRVLAVERFVVGMRTARTSMPKAGQITRDMIGALTELGRTLPGVTVVQRCAADVMPWATDKRLSAAGLLDLTKGMPHARAAARHALFSAVRDGDLPDPLSTKVRAT